MRAVLLIDGFLSSGFTASRAGRLGRSFSRIDDVDEEVGRGPIGRYTKIILKLLALSKSGTISSRPLSMASSTV